MPWRLMRLLASGTTCTWYSINSIPCHKIATTLFLFWTSHIVFFNHYYLTRQSQPRGNKKIGKNGQRLAFSGAANPRKGSSLNFRIHELKNICIYCSTLSFTDRQSVSTFDGLIQFSIHYFCVGMNCTNKQKCNTPAEHFKNFPLTLKNWIEI